MIVLYAFIELDFHEVSLFQSIDMGSMMLSLFILFFCQTFKFYQLFFCKHLTEMSDFR